MQIAAQAAALLFPRRHQVFARALEISRKLHCVCSYTYLASKVIEQAMVSRSKGLTPWRGGRAGVRALARLVTAVADGATVLPLCHRRQQWEMPALAAR